MEMVVSVLCNIPYFDLHMYMNPSAALPAILFGLQSSHIYLKPFVFIKTRKLRLTR